MPIKPILALILLLVLALPHSPALAYLFTYTQPTQEQPGKFGGELPLDKIAFVLLPRGTVSFEGDQLKIRAVPRWLFDRNLVLQGTVIRAEVVSQPNSSIIGGLVYFYDGQWLDILGHHTAIDLIDTINGAQLRGRVITCIGQSLQVRKNDGSIEKIAFSNIKAIKSPRAFTFNLTSQTTNFKLADESISFEASQIVFKQTRTRYALLAKKNASLPKSNLSGTEMGISKAALAYFVAFDIMSIIAPAIVIPLVINNKNQAAAQATINKSLAATAQP